MNERSSQKSNKYGCKDKFMRIFNAFSTGPHFKTFSQLYAPKHYVKVDILQLPTVTGNNRHEANDVKVDMLL